MPHDCFCSDNDWTNSENRTRGVSIKRWRSSSSAFFDIHWRTNNRSARAAFIGFGKCVPNKQTVNFSKMALLATTSSTMEKKISKQGFRMSKFRMPVDAVTFSLGMWWINGITLPHSLLSTVPEKNFAIHFKSCRKTVFSLQFKSEGVNKFLFTWMERRLLLRMKCSRLLPCFHQAPNDSGWNDFKPPHQKFFLNFLRIA